MKRHINAVLILLCAFLLFTASARATVTVDPMGITAYLEEPGETVETVIYLMNDSEESILYSTFVRELNVDRDGGPRRDDRGGPDDFEMEWRDSDEDDGPVYDWIDISEYDGVIDIDGLQDDAICGTYEMGFEIEYYGEAYNEVSIYPNGFASFVEAEIPFFYPWPALPSSNYDPQPPPTLQCVCYQDLNPAVSGNVYYWTDETKAVVTWQDVPHFDDANAEEDLWTFQMIVYPNGLIKYQYKAIGLYDVDPNQLSIMVGFQNEGQDEGFTIYRDVDGNEDEYLYAELSIALGASPAWINWIEFDPATGRVNSGDEAEITVSMNTEELEIGEHAIELTISLQDAEIPYIKMPIVLSIGDDVGSIAGTITSAATDEAVENVMIDIQPYGFVRYTDDNGQFILDNLPVGDYSLTYAHPDFLPVTLNDVVVEVGDEADGSIALLHAEFIIADVDSIDEEMVTGETQEFQITAANEGTGTTRYEVSKRYRGDFDFEAWEHRADIPASEITGEARLEGVTFALGNYYLTGDNRNDTSKVFIISPDNELIGSINQPDGVDNDMKGLAFDGTYLWGSGTDVVYQMDLEGTVENMYDGPHNSNNYIAWNPVDSIFYFAATTRDIASMTYDGELQEGEIDRLDMRLNGIDYWQDDPDGYNMYVAYALDGQQIIAKIDIATGDTMNVFAWDDAEGEVAEFTISNAWDVYNWVFMCMIDDAGADQIRIWNLAPREDWYSISPLMGEIEAGGEQVFTLTLNTINIPDGRFEGQLVFDHSGRGSQLMLNVNLEVVEPPQPPTPFNLLKPENAASIYAQNEVVFGWSASIDPNVGEAVGYELSFYDNDEALVSMYMTEDTILTVDMMEVYSEITEEESIPVDLTWLVTAVSGDDRIDSDSTFSLRWQPDWINDIDSGLPKMFAITDVYPNPFNSTVTLKYSLDRSASLQFKLFDHQGRIVADESLGHRTTGYYSLSYDGSALPTGVYILSLQANDRVRTSKLVLIK
ncbi:carboxypeptidase regulatory-like domain-containing protein [Calditrichota bacterium]